MREPDPALGWRNKPGSYLSPPYVPGGQGNRVRILSDGSCASSDQPPLEGPRAVLVGGSFIFGQEISDQETMAWQLQVADRRRRYANFSVASYGTYQSLLSLERIFSGDDPPGWVIYGLIGHHKTRNVGRSAWLRHLSRFSRYFEVTLLYCSLDRIRKACLDLLCECVRRDVVVLGCCTQEHIANAPPCQISFVAQTAKPVDDLTRELLGGHLMSLRAWVRADLTRVDQDFRFGSSDGTRLHPHPAKRNHFSTRKRRRLRRNRSSPLLAPHGG